LNWHYWNSQKYKVGQLAIGIVKLNYDEWLLFTVGKIKGIKDISFDSGVGYEEGAEYFKKYFKYSIIENYN